VKSGPERLAEVKALTNAATATLDYRDIVNNDRISVVYISTTPGIQPFSDCARLPEGRQARCSSKADRARTVRGDTDRDRQARQPQIHHRLFAAFNSRLAYAKKSSVTHAGQTGVGDGEPASVARLARRSPAAAGVGAAMESTHDLDFVFWLLDRQGPVRVYSQGAYGYMKDVNGSYDIMWSTVTMDNGVLVSIGGGWNLPPS